MSEHKTMQESIDEFSKAKEELNKVLYKEVFTPILDVVTDVLTWIMKLFHIRR